MRPLNRPFRVNEAVVRGVALQVFALSAWAVFTANIIPVLILFGDFFIRAVLTPRLSPAALVSRKVIVPIVGFRSRQIMFKPKRFAAGIGLFMTAAGSIFYLYDQKLIFTIIISILVLFSFLEAVLNFCAGCKIFGLLIKLRIIDEDECQDCKFQDGSGI